MDSTLSHDATSELLGAFALDAVEGFEAAAVTAHLAACTRCRDEVAQHQQVAATLAATCGPAPAGLWDSIAARIEQPTPTGRTFPLPQLSGPSQRTALRRGRRSLGLRAGAVLGIAAAASIAILSVDVGHLDSRLNNVAANSSTQTLSIAARNALLDPTSKRIILESTGANPRPAAEVVALRSGSAYLFNDGLPPLGAADTYQLWAMIDGQPISVGLLGTNPTTSSFSLEPSDLTDAFAVTVEPAGGSIGPTSRPVASTTV